MARSRGDASPLERIFDEYYQVDTHGTKRMGVGLGLAIVKEVARLLSFKVTITSTVGRCTEVTLDIPASRVTRNQAARIRGSSCRFRTKHALFRRLVDCLVVEM